MTAEFYDRDVEMTDIRGLKLVHLDQVFFKMVRGNVALSSYRMRDEGAPPLEIDQPATEAHKLDYPAEWSKYLKSEEHLERVRTYADRRTAEQQRRDAEYAEYRKKVKPAPGEASLGPKLGLGVEQEVQVLPEPVVTEVPPMQLDAPPVYETSASGVTDEELEKLTAPEKDESAVGE